jgi:hypothetical protein
MVVAEEPLLARIFCVKSSLAVDDFRLQSDNPGRRRLDRLRLLDIEQMAMTLAFLTGYRPATFGLAAAGGPEPHCTSCGGAVGIFLGHATDWQHFRTGGAGEGARVEVYDTDHAPTIGWRCSTPAVPAH